MGHGTKRVRNHCSNPNPKDLTLMFFQQFLLLTRKILQNLFGGFNIVFFPTLLCYNLRQNLCRGLLISEVTLTQHHEAKRSRRKHRQQITGTSTSSGTAFTGDIRGREYFSNIGLYSHRRRCNFRGTQTIL